MQELRQTGEPPVVAAVAPQNPDLPLLKHQHDQQVRSLKQSYELRMQKLKDALAERSRRLTHDVTEDNRAAVDMLGQKAAAETKQELENLRRELKLELASRQKEYEEQVRRFHDSTLSRHGGGGGQEETAEQVPPQQQDDLAQMHDTTDELAATKAQLKSMKHEYQANMHDLENALTVSKEHMQTNYELISSLKHDQQKLVDEAARLRQQLALQEAQVLACAAERKELARRVELNQVDTRTYTEQTGQLARRENDHALAARTTQDALVRQEMHSEQCAAAIRQAREQMEVEHQKHVALRQDYQDHVDRVQSLNEALDRCKQKNISTNEVLKDMSDRYAELKAQSETMMHEHAAYRREQEAVRRMQAQTTPSAAEAEEHTKRLHALQSHAHHSLQSCQQKSATCLQQSRHQEAYIQKLEEEIRKALRVIRDHDRRADTAASAPSSTTTDDTTSTVVRESAWQDLQREVEQLKRENAALKDHVKSFADHHEFDERMSSRHSHLKAQHQQAGQWIDEMKSHHKELHDTKARLTRDIEAVNGQLNSGEEAMQRASSQIRDLEAQAAEQREKAAKCLYPGERERFGAQIEALLRERNALRETMSRSTSEHAQMNQRLQELVRENEALRLVKQRFEMDSEQMQNIVAQSSELNVELINARRLLDKKEKQLQLLSGQLATMLQRVKTLEEREQTLEDKLRRASAPEELDSLMAHLTACRAEQKTHTAKYAAAHEAAEMMKAQLQASQVKIQALMEVLKDSEQVRAEWHKARKEQEQLQATLQQCSQKQHVSADLLQQRLRAMEEVYSHNAQSHERMMAESNARIAALQEQLQQASRVQKDIMNGGRVKPEQLPLTRDERTVVVEQRVDEVAAQAKKELTELSRAAAAAPHPTATTEAAINAAKLESVADLSRLKALHQQNMRDKERQIMAAREQTYDQLLGTLDAANRDARVQPEDLYGQIRDIRVRGAAQEQQVMADMLRLRAINARLATEYQAARAAQAELLHKANVTQRQHILQLTGDGSPPSLLQQNAQAYQALMGAHRDYITTGSRDVGAQLAEQTQYIRELERQYPKMEAVVASTNLQRFPSLDALQKQVSQEKTFTVGAVDFERREAVGQDRTQSALEAQLKAADASVRAMTDMVRRYVSQPTPDHLSNLRLLTQMSPGQIQEQQKFQADLQNRSAVRTQAVIQPRRPQDGPPGKNLAADMATGELQTRSASAPPQTPPTRYFHDAVSVFGAPTQTFAPTVERAMSQLQNDQDLIVLTYSFELARSERSLKWLLFEHALRAIFPRVQQLSSNGALELQLVKITGRNARFDMFDPGHSLADGCTYSTCQARKLQVNHITDVDQLLAQLRKDQFTNPGTSPENENHMVLTLGAPNSQAHIHITDILFMPTENGGTSSMPTVDKIRLLDGSWRGYLVDILQKPKSKIDLIFNVVPYAEHDVEAQEANHRLLQVMDRVQTYLKQVKGVQ